MVLMVHFWAHSILKGTGFPVNITILGHDFDLSTIFSSGSDGVKIFFVLSAFLLYMPFVLAEKNGTEFTSTKTFYKRRLLGSVKIFV